MPFVKLDTNILNSTLWYERVCRDVFLTALLMADPEELLSPLPQLDVKTAAKTGWIVPPGWYGFVACAGIAIIRRAIIEDEKAGLKALVQLGEPEAASKTTEYEGRRLVRVEGGFVVLNYFKYRDRDYTAAGRSKLYRQRKRHGVSPLRDGVTQPFVTQANAKAQAEADAELIYCAYPRKVGKPAALRAIRKAMNQFGSRILLEKTSEYAKVAVEIEPTFIPHPATWFNQERFNDDPSTWVRSSGKDQSAAQLKIQRDKGKYPSNVDIESLIK